MDAREETLSLLSKVWLKLQSLSSAQPVELGAFFVLLIFILTVLLMAVVTCVTCCGCGCCCCCCRRCKAKRGGAGV